MKSRILILSGLLLAPIICYGFSIDSLDQVLNKIRSRKRKVEILNTYNSGYILNDPSYPIERFRYVIEIAEEIRYYQGKAEGHENLAHFFFRNNLPDSAINHYRKALEIYQGRIEDFKTASTLFNMAHVFFAASRYVEAFEHANKSLEIFSIINDLEHQASCHALICDILSNSGFGAEAVEHCLAAFNLYEEMESLTGQTELLNSIGNIYLNLNQLDKSFLYFNQAYNMAEMNGNREQLASSYRNLGRFYINSGDYENAQENFQKALDIERKIGDISRIGYLYLDLGILDTRKTDFESALENLREALSYADSSYNMDLKARAYTELGSYYSSIQKFDIAIVFLKQSLFIAQQINADPVLQACYKNLAEFYDEVNDTENALRYFKMYVSHKDSLFTHQSAQQIAETEALYALDQKDQQIELLRSENRLREMEASEKRMLNIWLISVLSFVFLLTLILYRQYRIQNKVNQALNEQKDAINKQKLEIEFQKESIEKANNILAEKNRQITDSLEYAKRIQLSLLQDGKILWECFKEAFIWYLPRDIVGGDFYWYAAFNHTLCLVVMDCSGHGVPGAFMTVLANTLLNKGILEIESYKSPEDVLNYLDINVRKELNQQGITLSAFEGIDLAVCIFNTKTRLLKYSGAKMPLYHFSNGVLNYIKGDRFSIGGGNIPTKKFLVNEIKLKSNDVIYLATDGFQDQFGGKDGRKYMKLGFKKLLKSIASDPMDHQKDHLIRIFQEWKDFNVQTDDILIVGIRV